MPIYQYICEECNEKFDATVSAHDTEENRLKQSCPKCGKKEKVRRCDWGIGGMYITTIGGHGRRKI